MIPKWLLQPPASSTYIKMFKGKKKGCRKRKEKEKKKVGGSYLKKPPASYS